MPKAKKKLDACAKTAMKKKTSSKRVSWSKKK